MAVTSGTEFEDGRYVGVVPNVPCLFGQMTSDLERAPRVTDFSLSSLERDYSSYCTASMTVLCAFVKPKPCRFGRYFSKDR